MLSHVHKVAGMQPVALKRSCTPCILTVILPLACLLSGCMNSDDGSAELHIQLDTTTTEPSSSTFLPPRTSTTAAGTMKPRFNTTHRNNNAYFLMQATFGPTRQSLEEMGTEASYIAWIRHQMSLPAESHREYFRARVNSRILPSSGSNLPIFAEQAPCQVGSLWHRFAFTLMDVGKEVSADGSSITIGGKLVSNVDHSYSRNGLHAPTSCTNVPPTGSSSCSYSTAKGRCRWGNNDWRQNHLCQQWCWDEGYGYDGFDCSVGWPALRFSGYICRVDDEKVGGSVTLNQRSDCSGDNVVMRNPGIWLQDTSAVLVSEASFAQSAFSEDFIVLVDIPDSCEHGDSIKVGDDFVRFYPRYHLKENSLERPALGGAVNGVCVNAPKHILNEDSCRLIPATETCQTTRISQDAHFDLTSEALAQIHATSGRYVFYITGLRAEDTPCGVLSRWVQLDCGSSDCSPSTLSSSDESLIQASLQAKSGTIRDVVAFCSRSSVPPGAKVQVGAETFQHVHLNEYNVYDFTAWVEQHPGGSAAITRWATGDFELKWQASHGMERWRSTVVSSAVVFVGLLGSSRSFADIPPEIQIPEIAVAFFGSSSNVPYVWACGSPGEVASQATKGHQFPVYAVLDHDVLDLDIDSPYHYKISERFSKRTVWFMKALYAKDQLRQRMAWALSQIFVTSTVGLLPIMDRVSESWTTYYDIFIRNAFGKYGDLLREITFSPLMGEYLSFVRSRSFDSDGTYPDENYAREIMQLFTVGLWKLNPDGTYQTDSQGDSILTYTNADVMDFARIFTGFDDQPERANIEQDSTQDKNRLDPMQMSAAGHDPYPKMDLYGGYVGDNYPLCEDLPDDAFRSAGATYKLEGVDTIADPHVFHLVAGTDLFTALCGSAAPPCSSRLKVTLPADVRCSGAECEVFARSLSIISVGTMFYRYIPAPCVYLYFYASGIKSIEQDLRYHVESGQQCENPALPVAGAACCNGCTNINSPGMVSKFGVDCENATADMLGSRCNTHEAWRNDEYCALACFKAGYGYSSMSKSRNCANFGRYVEMRRCSFSREHLAYSQAIQKCASRGLDVCWQRTEPGCDHEVSPAMDVWMSEACEVSLLVFPDGRAAHQCSSCTKSAANPVRVAWTDGQYPTAQAPPSQCTTLPSDVLECRFETQLRAVFSEVPSGAALETRLRIAAFPPRVPCTQCEGEVRSYIASSGTIDMDTVFEYNGRFWRNVEAVALVDAFSFRNAPTFLVAKVPTEAAALAEVEAFLEHLINHPNTAPNVARLLIQRFTTSTPSPSYVASVATAFKTGAYAGETFSGQIGDLAATITAILLHPEARGDAEVPSKAGKLREPIIKFMHLMRSMEYNDMDGREVVLKLNEGEFGQWPYSSPTVFNFYHPRFTPSGMDSSADAPEFEIFTAPNMVVWLNAALELIEYGLNGCDVGFGMVAPHCNHLRDFYGILNFSDVEANVISELDTLLTGGRLGPSMDVVHAAFRDAEEGQKLKAAQMAVIMTPEFHTLGDMEATGMHDFTNAAPGATRDTDDYKAVVMMFFEGGLDSFNMLVPLSCALTDEYLQVRTHAALNPDVLIPVSTSGQNCSSFGVHPALPYMASLYSQGDLAFASNIGNMVEPVTAGQFKSKTSTAQQCVGLFAHDDQTKAAHSMQCQTTAASSGFGGRIGDVLSSQGYNAQTYSMAGHSLWSVGDQMKQVVIDERSGAVEFKEYARDQDMIHDISHIAVDNVYADEYNKEFWQGVEKMEELTAILATSSVSTTFDSEVSISRQLYQVARLISTHRERKSNRDLFYVQLSGVDHHKDKELEELTERFQDLNAALESFVTEMKSQGEFDNVVLVSGSDFGRTLTTNGEGTDHAYAGQYFALGGRIRGGNILNKYPSSLLEGSEQDIGRGRLVPKYPLENLYTPVAEWLGVPNEELSIPFRNLQNFDRERDILSLSALFA